MIFGNRGDTFSAANHPTYTFLVAINMIVLLNSCYTVSPFFQKLSYAKIIRVHKCIANTLFVNTVVL